MFDLAPDVPDEPLPREAKSGTVDSPDIATSEPHVAAGEKAKARDLIEAIRVLKRLESEDRRATSTERTALEKYCGFGPVALSLFPHAVSGHYKDASWRSLGEQLASLLTPEEYASARRTVFNAFYTSPLVVTAVHQAIRRLGVPDNGSVLEPGCGSGNFMRLAPTRMQFIGVELDGISSRIAKALHPGQDIRHEDFQKTRLPASGLNAVIGNVPFADLKLDYRGEKLALHDYFIRKSIDALAHGGIMAVVSSHYTLDKQNASAREAIGATADFLGAIRLPSDAFKREGTAVVTDILFLRKRVPGEPPKHADPDWLTTGNIEIDAAQVPVNRYFLKHPDMVLGQWSRQDTLYGGDTAYSVLSNGDLKTQLSAAVAKLPELALQKAIEIPSPESAEFIPPPPDKHVTEGSFFVGSDQRIHQILEGKAQPVVYGGTAWSANGTMTGKRMAALILLRDRARRVLQSQNDGWPDAHREQARRELNHAYDHFLRQYGPINKTTFSASADGTAIRRMPNLAKFREDPDAMLVMALEEYDEVTGEARKAPILRKDVVGRSQPVSSVATAEEGLLISLDRKGAVDLPFIASLYGKSEDNVIAELGDLIYRDPASHLWETKDAYLSGNVRAKLIQAEAGGPAYSRNAEALRQVQPADVLPGEIDANLGAPWIPESDIRAFAAELFGVPAEGIQLAHLKKEAVWSLEAGYAAERSVAATADYGTNRANGTMLLDLALNMKSPVIYDTLHHGDREEKVVNNEETLAAREKQKRIKETFRQWIFADPDRTERLVRLYNDTYNNIRLRQFDGSHLGFPGLSDGINLRQHQRDAVWRGMSGGNTLLAHVVGAGKTFTMAATGMKMRQAGLVRKPMFVVPNHMLEQFSREFLQLYPNARLLVASKEDLTRERRKYLTAKIASGDWDGIIVTHGSFERIGMSREYQEQFLREQIAEYDNLLVDRAKSDASRAQRNIIKTIEKQKARREERLKDLLAQDKKDDGLVFDELGVDHIFIDEAHYFKNLETPTKMERVAGIQTGGSERAFDLYMKSRYLGLRHPGHGVTFATGTPVSNSMMELYTMQRYLDPDGLKTRGIEPFDAWAATFGEVVETMEISPDGASLRPRSRFARFTNLPELQQMVRSFADVQTAEMLNLPRPKLEGGKAHIVASAMSETQQRLQKELVERYDRLRSQKVDPRIDNALNITTDGRKLALDARLLDAKARDNPDSKINALAENVASIWRRTAASKGTQMIFCDIGVNATPWGYCVYDDIIAKLAARGIPASEIATVGEADSDAKKQALFERVRNGTVRVLIGSTMKMGSGTNVQKRLAALHHLDAPWKPAEVEQREGRILRQGNSNEEVSIFRYVTEGSFDAYMWQALETKAKFIAQIMTGESAVRSAEDVAGQELSYAEVKAIASGNPAILVLARAEAELQRLAILRKNHADEQYTARRKIRELPEIIQRQEARLQSFCTDRDTMERHANDPILIGNSRVVGVSPVDQLAAALERSAGEVTSTKRSPLGTFRGLAFGIERHPGGAADIYTEGAIRRSVQLSRESQGPRAVMNALQRLAESIQGDIVRLSGELDISRSQLRDYQSRTGKSFEYGLRADRLAEVRDRLKRCLSGREEIKNEDGTDATAGLIRSLSGEAEELMENPTMSQPARPVEGNADFDNPRIISRGVSLA